MSEQTADLGAREAPRTLARRTGGMAASDGAGVSLRRMIATPEIDMVDPFLLLDFFGSDKAEDYIAGFPDHPHRGFETVTYMLAGRSRHKDSTGREGVIETGDVQWMTAGSGIIHSEMPEQEDGLLAGFQLWVNLPAKAKMIDPRYQEYKADEIPTARLDGGTAKVIAGTAPDGTVGPVENEWTDPIYMDVSLEAGATLAQTVPESHNAFVHCIEGSLAIGDGAEGGETLGPRELGILQGSGPVVVTAHDGPCRFLIVAGRRLNEPVARHGPFVMNTRDELIQAVQELQSDTFIKTAARTN